MQPFCDQHYNIVVEVILSNPGHADRSSSVWLVECKIATLRSEIERGLFLSESDTETLCCVLCNKWSNQKQVRDSPMYLKWAEKMKEGNLSESEDAQSIHLVHRWRPTRTAASPCRPWTVFFAHSLASSSIGSAWRVAECSLMLSQLSGLVCK